MFNHVSSQLVYTPEEVGVLLNLSKNSVYDLINRGEIIAKRYGKVFRIPARSLSFIFTGLDEDLYLAQENDQKNLEKINKEIKALRKI